MKAVSKILAGGVAAATLFSAAPAAAQYYPGYGGNPVGEVINQVLGNGYGYNGNYGVNNSQAIVNQCVSAVQARLSGGYSAYGASPYGYGQVNGYGRGRVLGISRVEPRSDGGMTVRGVASSGRGAYAYGGAYGGQSQVDLTWRCKSDYRGYVYDVNVTAARASYGNGYAPTNGYTPYENNAYDYSQYGYQRY